MTEKKRFRCQQCAKENQLVEKISVTVSGKFLQEIGESSLEKLTENAELLKEHRVQLLRIDDFKRLEGCFCGIEIIRNQLKEMQLLKRENKKPMVEQRKPAQCENYENEILTSIGEENTDRSLRCMTNAVAIDRIQLTTDVGKTLANETEESKFKKVATETIEEKRDQTLRKEKSTNLDVMETLVTEIVRLQIGDEVTKELKKGVDEFRESEGGGGRHQNTVALRDMETYEDGCRQSDEKSQAWKKTVEIQDVFHYAKQSLGSKWERVEAAVRLIESPDNRSQLTITIIAKSEEDDDAISEIFKKLAKEFCAEEHRTSNSRKSSQLVKGIIVTVSRKHEVDLLRERLDSLISEPFAFKPEYQSIDVTDSVEALGANVQKEECNCPRAEQDELNLQQHNTAANRLRGQVEVDEDIYAYVQQYCAVKLKEFSEQCTSLTSISDGIKFTVIVEIVGGYKKLDKTKRRLKSIFDDISVTWVAVPQSIDFEGFASCVIASNRKQVSVIPDDKGKRLKLVGYNSQVKDTKHWIDILARDNCEVHKTSVQPKKSSVEEKPNQRNEDQQIPKPKEQRPSPCKTRDGCKFSIKSPSTNNESLVFESVRAKNKLTVRVRRGDIIKEMADSLVCPTDVKLNFNKGRLANCIIKAVQQSNINEELEKIRKHMSHLLHEGGAVHIPSGQLQGKFKKLILAFRPTPNSPQVQGRQDDCFSLSQMFLNCVKCANKLDHKSISLPPIGRSYYGTDMVVKAFFEAIEEFDAIAETTRNKVSLQNIQLIENDAQVCKEIISKLRSLVG